MRGIDLGSPPGNTVLLFISVRHCDYLLTALQLPKPCCECIFHIENDLLNKFAIKWVNGKCHKKSALLIDYHDMCFFDILLTQ